jgi:hypothetical protein
MEDFNKIEDEDHGRKFLINDTASKGQLRGIWNGLQFIDRRTDVIPIPLKYD